jgi:hypothetical protein
MVKNAHYYVASNKMVLFCDRLLKKFYGFSKEKYNNF